jgi:hypothetical protein
LEGFGMDIKQLIQQMEQDIKAYDDISELKKKHYEHIGKLQDEIKASTAYQTTVDGRNLLYDEAHKIEKEYREKNEKIVRFHSTYNMIESGILYGSSSDLRTPEARAIDYEHEAKITPVNAEIKTCNDTLQKLMEPVFAQSKNGNTQIDAAEKELDNRVRSTYGKLGFMFRKYDDENAFDSECNRDYLVDQLEIFKNIQGA